MMEDEPRRRSSSDTRQALTVALVKPGRGACWNHAIDSFSAMLPAGASLIPPTERFSQSQLSRSLSVFLRPFTSGGGHHQADDVTASQFADPQTASSIVNGSGRVRSSFLSGSTDRQFRLRQIVA
jgi:hypothetical protein